MHYFPYTIAILLLSASSLTRSVTPLVAQVTTSFQDGLNGYNGTRDTKLVSRTPTSNFGTAQELELDGQPETSTLLYWDLSGISPGSTVLSVDVTVNITNPSGHIYEFYESLRPWVEGEATWSVFAAGGNWQVAGANGALDRGYTPLGNITGTRRGLLTVPLNSAGVALVQSWVDNPATNHGFIILNYARATDGLFLSSREDGVAENRPKLTVTSDPNGAPGLSIDDISVSEGNTGTVNAAFTVSMSKSHDQTVTVNYATTNGNAIAPGDYIAVTGQVSFQPGETSRSVIVLVNGDLDIEPNETFFVNLSNAVNALIGDNRGVGTIIDDDASLPGEPITFSVTGDYPYGANELDILRQHMDYHNLYSPSDFFVHVGDINADTEICTQQRYEEVSNILKTLAVPVFIIIGDNEWTDCSDPAQAFQWWQESFANFEENFEGAPVVERQAARPENWAFVSKGVLFIGINIVGGSIISINEENVRLQDDADWVDLHFQNKSDQVRAAVVFGHAGTSLSRNLFFEQFRASSKRFTHPVFYIMGEEHIWTLDEPWPEENMERLIVNRGGDEDPPQITVTMDPNNPFEIVRNPWQGQSRPTNVLNHSFPNPFYQETRIEYTLIKSATVRLAVYNVLGQQVRVLVDEVQNAGINSALWDGRDSSGVRVASGVYFARLLVGGQRFSRKLIVQ